MLGILSRIFLDPLFLLLTSEVLLLLLALFLVRALVLRLPSPVILVAAVLHLGCGLDLLMTIDVFFLRLVLLHLFIFFI